MAKQPIVYLQHPLTHEKEALGAFDDLDAFIVASIPITNGKIKEINAMKYVKDGKTYFACATHGTIKDMMVRVKDKKERIIQGERVTSDEFLAIVFPKDIYEIVDKPKTPDNFIYISENKALDLKNIEKRNEKQNEMSEDQALNPKCQNCQIRFACDHSKCE